MAASRPAAKRRRVSAKASAPAGERSADLEDVPAFAADEVSQVRVALLEWYDRHHRVLPWRRNAHSKRGAPARGQPTPAPADLPRNEFAYRVWVCEVMSQQTQVSRVVEYHQRWIARWPTVQALAEASQDEVNELWAGLGYYRRAGYLLNGARHVVETCGGVFPSTARELQRIPGIGAYTGAAIASIAFDERIAAVDANVVRVLARLRAVSGDPVSREATVRWAALAGALVDPERPGDFNQAMMELGATVCTGNAAPSCTACPIRACCLAHQRYAASGGAAPPVTAYPAKVVKAAKRLETVDTCVLEARVHARSAAQGTAPGAYLLMAQRPKAGLLGGLWEFPSLAADEGVSAAKRIAALDDYVTRLVRCWGLLRTSEHCTAAQSTGVLEELDAGELVHVFSHIRMTIRVRRVVVMAPVDAVLGTRNEDPKMGLPELRWVRKDALDVDALSSSVKKVYALAQLAGACAS